MVLEWNAPAVSDEVTSYKVYRDGSEIAQITQLTYTDEDLLPATYEYYVTAIYSDGQESEPSNTISVELTENDNNLLPAKTALLGNYPNPFNPTTTIRFDLAKDALVTLNIYNMKGQIVKTLLRNELPAGTHRIDWNGTDQANRPIASGIYFYRFKAGDYQSNGKCILLK